MIIALTILAILAFILGAFFFHRRRSFSPCNADVAGGNISSFARHPGKNKPLLVNTIKNISNPN